MKKADTLILESNEELQQVVCQLEEMAQTILREKQQMDWCQRREKEFAQFCTDYIEYQADIQIMERMKQDKLRLEDRKKQAIAWMETCIEHLKTAEAQKQELLRILEEQKISSSFRKRLKPMCIMCNPQLRSPAAHSFSNFIGHFSIKFSPIVNDIN